MLLIEQIPILEDNYSYLLRDEASKKTAVIDPGEAPPILQRLQEKKWKLDFIFNTHHHPDHVGANLQIQLETACVIFGPLKDKHRIPGIQNFLSEGDSLNLGESSAKILEVPGHTTGHVAIYFERDRALFSGDMIFSLGSGFLFEGTPKQMWQSLERLRSLPEDTMIYGAHEYTLGNARYALHIDANNKDLQRMVERAKKLRESGLPTVPTTLREEKLANPFLRPDNLDIQRALHKVGQPLDEVFAAIRFGKDAFDRAHR